MSKSPTDVLSQIKDEGIELIDLKFTDIHGKWQHLTLTSDMIEEDSFTEGLANPSVNESSSIMSEVRVKCCHFPWISVNFKSMSSIPSSLIWLKTSVGDLDIKFIIEPYIRFKGEPGEQATMFFKDPSGNALEFKAFKSLSNLFQK